jgi:phosphatidylserine decarboxylase
MPHRFFSRIIFFATRWKFRPWKSWLINRIVKAYAVDLSEAADPILANYVHFNAFFTRALKPDARPIDTDESALVCPADGAVSQLGETRDGCIVQAKGMDYSVEALIGGDRALAADFAGGSFATIYLSPRDYHRVHMPMTGTLLQTIHVPGRLFSVANWTAQAIPRLFARNERLVCVFAGAEQRFIVVLVGAILVSSMETVWSGVVTPPYASRISRRLFAANAAQKLTKGDEMGRFNMGSTAIVLTQKRASFVTGLVAGTSVKMGARIAKI